MKATNSLGPAVGIALAVLVATATTGSGQDDAGPDGQTRPEQGVEPFRPPAGPPLSKQDKPKDEAAPATSPEERDKLLTELYAQLTTVPDEQRAAPLVEAIERLWLYTASDTVAVLMERSLRAVADKKPELALRLLDAVVEQAPEYAEGWNRRAYVLYTQNDYQRALGDLRRVLALEPNHFKALDGLGQILRDIGEKKPALEAYRRLRKVHPNWPNVNATVEELDREVEGQGI